MKHKIYTHIYKTQNDNKIYAYIGETQNVYKHNNKLYVYQYECNIHYMTIYLITTYNLNILSMVMDHAANIL